MISKRKLRDFLLLLIVVFSIGFSRLNAQDSVTYRFIAWNSSFDVFVLKCEGVVCAQEGAIAEGKDIRAVSLSYDNDRVVGLWNQPNMDIAIQVFRTDGSLLAEYPLLRMSGEHYSSSAWSPDEQWLVLSPGNCFINIGVLSDGEQAICQYPGKSEPAHWPDIILPRWSPDGKFLLFSGQGEYYGAVGEFPRDDIWVMNIGHLLENGWADILSIVPTILGDCDLYDWLSSTQIVYRCYAFGAPFEEAVERIPSWFISNLETGDISSIDVPSGMVETEWMKAIYNANRIAFFDHETYIWNKDTDDVQLLTIPEGFGIARIYK
jgi:WD40 repeat protein